MTIQLLPARSQVRHQPLRSETLQQVEAMLQQQAEVSATRRRRLLVRAWALASVALVVPLAILLLTLPAAWVGPVALAVLGAALLRVLCLV